jgi:hypothetical protein
VGLGFLLQGEQKTYQCCLSLVLPL